MPQAGCKTHIAPFMATPMHALLTISPLFLIPPGTIMSAVWCSNAGVLARGVNWQRFSQQQLLEICDCVGGLGLAAVLRLMAEDHAGAAGEGPEGKAGASHTTKGSARLGLTHSRGQGKAGSYTQQGAGQGWVSHTEGGRARLGLTHSRGHCKAGSHTQQGAVQGWVAHTQGGVLQDTGSME